MPFAVPTAPELLTVMFHMETPAKSPIRCSAGADRARKCFYVLSLLGSIILLGGFADIFEGVRWASQSRSQMVVPATSMADARSNQWLDHLNHWPKSPEMTPEEQTQNLSKADILNDKLNRVASEFKIPPALRPRVAFWFDVYSKYGQYEHLIHHTRYPWIVYKIIDGNDIIASGKGPLWLRRQKINDLVATERKKIRTTLTRLASRKTYKNLSSAEKEIYTALESIPGSRRSVFRLAALSLRSQLGQKDFFNAGLSRSSKYLPLMEKEFARMNLPLELTRMPFVESSFNENAESKVGASGIWQIMPRTGKAYSLVNDVIDERNSPLKATLVAGQMLVKYKRALKEWPLVITSYNHGIGNIRKAIKAARSDDIATIIERYHRGEFKFASSNFFTSFLAALYAEKYNDVLFRGVVKEPLIDFVEIQLGQAIRVNKLLKVSGLSKEDLFLYNRDLKVALRSNGLLPKGFRLHLPPQQADSLIARIAKNIKIRTSGVPG